MCLDYQGLQILPVRTQTMTRDDRHSVSYCSFLFGLQGSQVFFVSSIKLSKAKADLSRDWLEHVILPVQIFSGEPHQLPVKSNPLT